MAQQHPSPEPVQSKPRDEDEILHTPTKHRARWVMGILLLIMILTTFTVGPQIVDILTGKGAHSAYATWNRPGVGKQLITGEDWQACMRSLGKLYSVMGNRQIQDSEIKQEVAANFVIGALAEDAGIAVTDSELGAFIVGMFGNAQNYHMILPQYRVTPKEFETTLRQLLVRERYTTLMVSAWNTPEPDEIEKSWKSQHQEYAFEYVDVPVDSLLNHPGFGPPTDEELHAYFNGLPPPRKDTFKSKEKLAADLAGLPYQSATPEALLAKFPAPTDEAEIQKQVQAYFDNFGLRRYAGKSLEEVKDLVRAEALTYGALQAWLKDMRGREERGLAINFDADAAALGVSKVHMATALDQTDWTTNSPAPWVGSQTVRRLLGNAKDTVAGKFCPDVIVDDTGFTIAQVMVKEEAAIPPFEQMADKLREEFREHRAREFATLKLDDLRGQFGTRPEAVQGQPAPPFMPEADEAKFAEVMHAAGYEVHKRDYKERSLPGIANPDPIDTYARTLSALYSAKPGAILSPGCDSEGKHVYLLRVYGARNPDPALMRPIDFASVSAGLQSAANREIQQKAFSLNALESRYGLAFNEKQSEQ